MSNIFKYKLTVPVSAVDVNGHANNVMYIQWMQDAAVEHSNAHGCTREVYEDLNATWVARSHFVEYIRPGFAGDEIEVSTWLSEWRKVGCRRKYQFVRIPDQILLARAETQWVYVSATSGRPRAVHAEIKDRIRAEGV